MNPWTTDLPRLSIRKALAMVVAGAFLFLLLWFGARDTQQVLVLEGSTMGTTWSVQLGLPAGSSPGPDLADAIASRLAQLDRGIFSTYVPDSALMRFNAAEPGRQIAIPDEMARVLALARVIHDQTGGAFDPTVGPLVRLWGFGVDGTAADVPADADIAEALGQVGMEALQLDTGKGLLLKSREVELDLSAIAKGFAVDAIANMLDEAGLDNYLVEIGGELLARGPGHDGEGWQLAIEIPDPSRRSPLAIISSLGQTLALAGSGDYRNYRVVDGQHYSHEIDPGTGRPVTHNLAATTVLADDAATADAWATALMVLGAEQGILLAEQNGIAAYFIMHEGDGFRTRATTGWQSQYPEL
jgi:thiamine biosynthesis lipoprotein